VGVAPFLELRTHQPVFRQRLVQRRTGVGAGEIPENGIVDVECLVDERQRRDQGKKDYDAQVPVQRPSGSGGPVC
jgi:hypothetical protein